MDAELALLAGKGVLEQQLTTRDICGVLDTLALARQMHPGQRNSLDALCKRYSIDNSHRDLHGALLDADLLLEVYLAMTGGQGALILDDKSTAAGAVRVVTKAARPEGSLVVRRATDDELRAHETLLKLLDKKSGGRTAWRAFERLPEAAAATP
jgi:DNA polymerase III subunit epsilon